KLAAEERESRGKGFGRRVVGGRKPAIAETGDAAQTRLRAPASEPQRDAATLPRRGGQPGRRRGVVRAVIRGRLRLKQGLEQADRLVEALPSLLERRSDRRVVCLGRTRADAGDHAAVGEDVQRR